MGSNLVSSSTCYRKFPLSGWKSLADERMKARVLVSPMLGAWVIFMKRVKPSHHHFLSASKDVSE